MIYHPLMSGIPDKYRRLRAVVKCGTLDGGKGQDLASYHSMFSKLFCFRSLLTFTFITYLSTCFAYFLLSLYLRWNTTLSWTNTVFVVLRGPTRTDTQALWRVVMVKTGVEWLEPRWSWKDNGMHWHLSYERKVVQQHATNLSRKLWLYYFVEYFNILWYTI